MNPIREISNGAGRLIIVALFLPSLVFAYVSPGAPKGFVNDFAGILSPAAIQTLEQTLTSFEKQTGNEISVVTIPTRGRDETIETYAVKLFEDWGIGKEKEDNGLLLLIARDDREMRIEVGYGLEPIITDIESAHIISDILAPAFQNGEYDRGISEAIARITSDIRSGSASEPADAPNDFHIDGNFFYILLFALVYLASILGKSKSWWAGGVVGAVVAIIIGFVVSLSAALIAGVFLVPFGLIFDYIVSRAHDNHRNGGPRPPWFLGGGGMGRGGGFGGFGGGMSGGGGASGRW